jgi:hypothetical protein
MNNLNKEIEIDFCIFHKKGSIKKSYRIIHEFLGSTGGHAH